MLTPTRREVATTPAAKVPIGAQLWGGRYDGMIVCGVTGWPRFGLRVVLLLEDGAELRLDQAEPVEWLHPASRRPS